MPYWCAAFGPNDSYFFNSPLKWSMCGLPDRINTLFNTGPKAKEIHEIALGPNGSYAIIFTDQTGIKVRHSGLPQPVEQWLLNHSGRAINSARDLASMQISLGPKGSYFAFDKNGCIWGNLPPALEAAVNERRNMNGYFKPGAYPYLVSLGAAGTYAMFTVGGGGSWYFGGQKNELDQYLHGLSSLMHVVCALLYQFVLNSNQSAGRHPFTLQHRPFPDGDRTRSNCRRCSRCCCRSIQGFLGGLATEYRSRDYSTSTPWRTTIVSDGCTSTTTTTSAEQRS